MVYRALIGKLQVSVFIRKGAYGKGERVEEGPGQPVHRMGRCAGAEVFDQGVGAFAQVDGVHAHYR
jgi:hypothetical protein